MPLLRNGQPVENDPWVRIEDDADLPTADGAMAVVSLSRFLEMMRDHRYDVAGVSLAPSDNTADLEPWLDRLRLVCIEVPVFTDGRGYSHARMLREQLGFSGEIRAIGDVRPDQVLQMTRVGINALEFAEQPDEELLTGILGRYQAFYQPSYSIASAD